MSKRIVVILACILMLAASIARATYYEYIGVTRVAAVSTSFDSYVLGLSPTHYWALSGSPPVDSADTLNLTAANVSFGSTPLGLDNAPSVLLNGSSSALYSGPTTDAAVAGNYTVFVCFKTTAGQGKLFGLESSQTTSSALFDEPSIYLDSDGTVSGGHFDTADKAAVSTITVLDGQPHCATLTYNGSTIVLYLDGVSVGSIGAAAQVTISPGPAYYRIGNGTGPNANWPRSSPSGIVNGNIEKVAYWRGTALGTTQIASLWTTFSGKTINSIFTQPSLLPLSPPTSHVTINSNACNGISSDAQNATYLQQGLDAAIGGTLWIPAGCVIHLRTNGSINGSNTTIMCAGDNVAGFYNDQGFVCSGGAQMLYGNFLSNVTVEGCTFSNSYNAANYSAAQTCLADSTSTACPAPYNSMNGCGTPFYLPGGNDIATFYHSSGINFNNNLIQHQFAGEGILLDNNGSNINPTNDVITNNVFVDNFLNLGLQMTNAPGLSFTHNWIKNTPLGANDQSTSYPNTSGAYTNNTYICTQDPATEQHSNSDCTGGYIGVRVCGVGGNGCDDGNCNYSGLNVANNIFVGAGMSVGWGWWGFNDGGGNVFQNGALNVCGHGGAL